MQTGDDRNKSFDKAAEAYNKVLEMKPDSGPAYNQLGNIYAAEGKMPEAEEALTKAAQLDPQTAPKAYFNMGANLVNHGKLDDAIPFFKKATDADPNYAEAWFQYGTLLMNKGAVDPKTGAQKLSAGHGSGVQEVSGVAAQRSPRFRGSGNVAGDGPVGPGEDHCIPQASESKTFH